MTKRRKPPEPKRSYDVGYGKPPAATRFQPGQSGNPKGRPKGSKSVRQILLQALNSKITVQVGGRPRSMTKLEAMLQGLVNSALRLDPRAVRTVLDMEAAFRGEAEAAPAADVVTADDAELFRLFLARHGVADGSAGGGDDGHADTPTESTNTDPTDKE